MDPGRRSKGKTGRGGSNAPQKREIARLDAMVRQAENHGIGPLDRSEFLRALTGELKTGRPMGQTLGSASRNGPGGTEPRQGDGPSGSL